MKVSNSSAILTLYRKIISVSTSLTVLYALALSVRVHSLYV